MGRFSNGLQGRLRGKLDKPESRQDVERLKCCAIQRDGTVYDGLRSHYELRKALGDANPQSSNLSDIEGFLTTTGRFVTRDEAQDIAVLAGQIRGHQGRPLLSSDINW